ncbi:M16 family metallopeptidase [Alkalilimnicola ehrlichii MLHE-1]|uniref:Peptidase M16 domain protein n=1 Tax=Alkalilimnicola ehrlichii (strain ATCC BAA-1101 / DSM 17681 / MLHE-1) TaxID=187272 RepID=Q0A590_ALKEH|nr:pitrilysin family protein [Alkalilimnicola ehrlichii]ABI57997.1 peptidase M16 domain protein [Alkalilimnicola ehrlichii MLHE-1]
MSLYRSLRHLLSVALAVLLVVALPASADEGEFAIPEIEHWETEVGVPVYFVRSAALPIIDVAVTFDAGSARECDQAGLARVTANLLDQGAAGLDAGEIARRLEDQGARLSVNAGREQAVVSLRSLAEEEALEAALAVLDDVLAAPDFPEDALARERQRRLVALRGERQSASAMAWRTLFETLYPGHPYARAPSGTEEGIRAIARADVQAFHADHYTTGNAQIALVGDLTREQAEALAERLSRALPVGDPAPPLPAVPRVPARTVEVAFPGTQTRILMGHPAIARGDEDLLALSVADHILGGSGLVSRIFQAMREERGLSYSSHSGLAPMRKAGPVVLGSQVRADRTGEALEVLDEELRAYLADGPDDEEMDRALRYLAGSFPLELESNRQLLSAIADIGFYGLPLDQLESYLLRLEALDRERVHRVLRERIDPDRMVTVLVGPPEEEVDDEALEEPPPGEPGAPYERDHVGPGGGAGEAAP